jgi:hypothetical protein
MRQDMYGRTCSHRNTSDLVRGQYRTINQRNAVLISCYEKTKWFPDVTPQIEPAGRGNTQASLLRIFSEEWRARHDHEIRLTAPEGSDRGLLEE